MGASRRHPQIAGKQVEQRGDIGGALDAGVSAQRHDSAAGPADVPSSSWMIDPGRMYWEPTVC